MDRCLFASAATANNSVVTVQTGQAQLKEFAHKDTIELAHNVSELIVFWIAIISALVPAFLGLKALAKKRIAPSNSLDYLYQLPQSRDVEKYLAHLVAIADASRASICAFGGGPDHGKFSDLSKTEYYSIIWESVNLGYDCSKPKYQNVKVKELSSLIALCKQKPEEFLFVNVDDSYLSDAIKYDMTLNRNELILLRLVGCAAGGFVGMFCLQFSRAIAIAPDLLARINEYFLLIENCIQRMVG